MSDHAYTIRRIEELREEAEQGGRHLMSDGHYSFTTARWEDVQWLLAERQQAIDERDALRQEVEYLRDRAVCSGCGSDVDEAGACHTTDCEDGEMIPSSDLPGALEDMAEQRRDVRDELRESEARCEQAIDALRVYADPRNWSVSRDDLNHRVVAWIGPGAEKAGMPDALETARAALVSLGEKPTP